MIVVCCKKNYIKPKYNVQSEHKFFRWLQTFITRKLRGKQTYFFTSQMKHQLDATLCRFYFCRVTLHVSGASAHHQEYLKLVIRRCDDLPATITHVPVAAVLVLNTPDDGRLRPKHLGWPCRNKTCTVLHQVGVSFDLYYDARKHKIKFFFYVFLTVHLSILYLSN